MKDRWDRDGWTGGLPLTGNPLFPRHISHFIHNVPFPSPQRPRILVQVRAAAQRGAGREEGAGRGQPPSF